MEKELQEKPFVEFLEDASSQAEARLRCPNCGGNNLHQIGTNVYDREEDATRGTHICIAGGEIAVRSDLTGNPSPRRQGAVISFDCESCTAVPQLHIYQHEGCTYLKLSK